MRVGSPSSHWQATGHKVVVLHNESRAARSWRRSAIPRPVDRGGEHGLRGLDIPRLRVGVYATAAKTPLMFRQIVGRFVRTIPGRPAEPSWLYIPADPALRNHAATVQQELRHALRPAGDEFADEFDRPTLLQTERGETPAFEPLSADVAPQLTLFGTPAPPVTLHRHTTDLFLTPPPIMTRGCGHTGCRRSKSVRGCETSATGSSPS